jgi:hypothetical protein
VQNSATCSFGWGKTFTTIGFLIFELSRTQFSRKGAKTPRKHRQFGAFDSLCELCGFARDAFASGSKILVLLSWPEALPRSFIRSVNAKNQGFF